MKRNKDFSGTIEIRPKKVSILGCGWLGLAVAKKLKGSGHVVKGSTTTFDKLPLLVSAGIDPFLVSLDAVRITGEIRSFLQETDVLIICIPPGSFKTSRLGFDLERAMEGLISKIENSAVRHIVLISSVSVYKATEEIPEYNESSALNGSSLNALALRSAEELFMEHSELQTTTIRFGGLIGPDRHPVTYLSERMQVTSPMAPVNLIGQEDCVGVIQHIVENEVFGEIFNAVAPDHPGREEYYHHQARLRKISLPQFDHQTVSKGKIVSSLKLESVLGYRFRNSIWEYQD